MTQTLVYPSTFGWPRSALRRRAERRPLEVQAEVASECSRSSLRLLLVAVRGAEPAPGGDFGPAPHGKL